MRHALTLLLFAAAATTLTAQHRHGAWCGTGELDVETRREAIEIGKRIAAERALSGRGNATTYIPIRFKLIGNTDGTGAASVNNLLNLMNSINVDFAPRDIQFFLDESGGQPWDYIFNDDLFTNHASFTTQLRSFKSTTAVTVYVPNDATPPGGSGQGVTLGYYSPTNDYLVFRRQEVDGDASTASHELGHYFSLPHTFQGWDGCSWSGTVADCNGRQITSPVTITTAPRGGLVELVARGAGANCANAGDFFCDTQANYSFGFSYPTCDYASAVVDRNGEALVPDENNFMSYFQGCNPYEFSDEQAAAMLGDYNSNRRIFLRRTSPGVVDPIVDTASVLSPLDGSTTPFSDAVELSWTPIANAQYYFVQVAERRSFRTSSVVFEEIIADGRTSIVLDDLEAGAEYFFRVRPFSQTSFTSPTSTAVAFTVGTASGVDALPEAATALTVFPNPLPAGQRLQLTATAERDSEVAIDVRDLTGRLVSRSRDRFVAGPNRLNVDLAGASVPRGTYLVTVVSDSGTSTRKVVID